ncbi:MAG: secretin N-terminal domain-containing protein [Planctomycetota bacterium]
MYYLRIPLAIACVIATCLSLGAAESANGPGPGDESSRPLTIEVSEKPLDLVLQWISQRSGMNISCNEEEQPKVTMRLINVSWQEAVEQLARKYDMVIEKRSDRIWELTRPPKVRMEFQNAQLTVVLDALAAQAGVNIVISDQVSGDRTLTMNLTGVPWREALDVIVKAMGYVWIEQDYDIIRVVTPDSVQKDLQTRVYQLNYTPGETASQLITVSMSEDGKVEHDSRTNSLILTDTPSNLDAAVEILRELDRRTQEVQIEMKFVEFNVSDALNFGFSGALDLHIQDFGSVASSFFPFSANAGRFVGPTRDEANAKNNWQSPALLERGTRVMSGNLSFEALNTLNSSEVVQTPNILTLNNTEAQIEIVDQVRWAETTTTSTDAGTEVTLEEAEDSPIDIGIEITVLPHITNDGFVSIDLTAKDETFEFQTFFSEESTNAKQIQLPQVSSKRIKSSIMVADGETAVIGGILSNSTEETESRIPLLGSIPVLGYLFRNHDEQTVQRDLTIFVTPRIIELSDQDDLEDAKLRLREQLSGLQLREETEEGSSTLGD